jgi:hypothetical protein
MKAQCDPVQLLCEVPGHLLCLEGDSGELLTQPPHQLLPLLLSLLSALRRAAHLGPCNARLE